MVLSFGSTSKMSFSRFFLLSQSSKLCTSNLRSLRNARLLFDETPDKLTSCNNKNLLSSSERASNATLTGVNAASCRRTKLVRLLRNCVALSDLLAGRRVHCLVVKSGFRTDPFVGATLVDLYSKSGSVRDARQLFDEITHRDIVLWNVLASCYASNGVGELAFQTFRLMRLEGFDGDGFTFSSLLSSCTSLGCCQLGKQTHGLVVKLSFDSDVVVGSALIDMYAKCGDIENASRTFEFMEVRNVVSWNSVIVGYGRKGEDRGAMQLLRRMLRGGWKPDELTLAAVLSSCADSAANVDSTQVHNYAVKNGFEAYLSVGNALICSYAKSGHIGSALQSFLLISHPDLVTWSSMMFSYAFHGFAQETINLFERMLREGVRPDRIAFLGVLSACSHAGLLETGLQYFGSMKRDYQIEPGSEHYTSLVDLLARSGRLHEAHDVITNMPFEPGVDVLGAFIGGCKVHGDIRLMRWAADRLFRLEPAETVNYMLMSNKYAALGCWDNVAEVRKIMRMRYGNKVPGFSWIEIGDAVRTFVSSDTSHGQDPDIYFLLGLLIRGMKDEGYKPEVMLTSEKFSNSPQSPLPPA